MSADDCVPTVRAECGHCWRSGIDGFLYRMPGCPAHPPSPPSEDPQP